MLVSKKDAEGSIGKIIDKGTWLTEVQQLWIKNTSCIARNADLQEKRIKAHDIANDQLTLFIQSLTQKSPSFMIVPLFIPFCFCVDSVPCFSWQLTFECIELLFLCNEIDSCFVLMVILMQ